MDEITAEMDNRQSGLTPDTTVVGTNGDDTLTEDAGAAGEENDGDDEEDEDTAEEISDEGEPSEGDVESAAEDEDVGKAVTSTGRKHARTSVQVRLFAHLHLTQGSDQLSGSRAL